MKYTISQEDLDSIISQAAFAADQQWRKNEGLRNSAVSAWNGLVKEYQAITGLPKSSAKDAIEDLCRLRWGRWVRP